MKTTRKKSKRVKKYPNRLSRKQAKRLARSDIKEIKRQEEERKEREEAYRRELEERQQRDAQAAAFVQSEMRRLHEENMRLKVLLITNGIKPDW